MNFITAKQRLARRRNKNATTLDTLTNARLGDFLNEAHRELLSEVGVKGVRDDVLTFATVNAQQRYAVVEQGIAKIHRIWETTNDHRLKKRSLAWLREIDADPPTGTPEYWIPLSTTQVAAQPADASEIFVKSTAAGDTNTCYIEGIITGGYRRTASVTMTGVTAVSLSTLITTFIQVDKFYLSAVAVGTVTLHEDSGAGTELARIAIGDASAKYASFLLYPTPSAVVTHYMDVTRRIADMANDFDEPLIDEDFHDLWLDVADLKELTKGDDPDRHRIVEAHRVKRRNEWREWMFGGGDPEDGAADRGGSNLGNWFPAGRW